MLTLIWHQLKIKIKSLVSSGNRTRAARVAGEHSTTEPTMLIYKKGQKIFANIVFYNFEWHSINLFHCFTDFSQTQEQKWLRCIINFQKIWHAGNACSSGDMWLEIIGVNNFSCMFLNPNNVFQFEVYIFFWKGTPATFIQFLR